MTLFEAKATRYPVPFADHLDAASFLGWLRKVAGERPGQRGPITQGARFVRKWREHDGACERELGAFRTNTDLRYVIISAEDLPVFAHWQKFRETLWRPQLGQEEQVLDERTLFVSIHDLEALAATLIALGARNTPRTIGELLDEWAAYWNRGAHILEEPIAKREPQGLKSSLRDFLISRYQPTNEHAPTIISDAHEEAWAAMKAMFDAG